jgi:hypothetical protein
MQLTFFGALSDVASNLLIQEYEGNLVSMAKQKSPIMAMKFPQVYLRLFHFAAPAE